MCDGPKRIERVQVAPGNPFAPVTVQGLITILEDLLKSGRVMPETRVDLIGRDEIEVSCGGILRTSYFGCPGVTLIPVK
jgi:hypothetical protein